MKSRKLLIGLLAFMFGAGVFVLTTSGTFRQVANQTTNLGEGSDNGWGYLASIRNNQTSGKVEYNDVLNARNQLKGFKSSGALGLNWTSLGPDNFAGRTRALLLSNQDATSKTLIAGGVSGGLWKSTTAGLIWYKIPTGDIVLNVSCITQAPNGTIYVGTGENFASARFNMFTGFIGQGIYKSTDGNTFTRINSTNPGTFNNANAEWAYVNRLAASDNVVYAATNSGLKVSTDGGESWTIAKAGSENLEAVALEVEIGPDGAVAATVGNKLYLSANGAADGFVLISGQVDGLPHDNLSRIEVAFAPSDPSTIYALLAATNGQMAGIYVSKDKGQTWRIVGPGSSNTFNVFSIGLIHYGDYVASIKVDPNDPDNVMIGGINVWVGNKVLETGFYQWTQLTSGAVTTFFHDIVIVPQNPVSTIYMATDDGVFLTSPTSTLAPLNRNMRTSMFYTVGYSDQGHVIGGTQGNGVLYIDGKGNTPSAAKQILATKVGGSVEMSMIQPTAMFYSSTAGFLERSPDLGFTIANDFASEAMLNPNGFITPFRLWESFNNPNSRDSITYTAKTYLPEGTVIDVTSKQNNFPFKHTLTNQILAGDSIKIRDIVSSRLFVGVANGVYLTNEALNFGELPQWFKIANIVGTPTSMAYSKDANYLFVGTKEGKVYRMANIALAYDSIRASVDSPSQIISTTLVNDFIGRYVTSISVDPNNDARVLVTLGNYGNDEFVYLSTNALDEVPVFNSIQGNLPKMPVYSSLIEMTTSNVIIGTEFGIFSAASIGENTNWTTENTGMGAMPVMQIRQQTTTRPVVDGIPGISNIGAIYIASHGNGIFENRLYVGFNNPFVKESNYSSLSVYPNPVSNQINFSLDVKQAGKATVKVYDLRGNLIDTYDVNTIKGVQRVTLGAEKLTTGTYMLQVNVGNEMKSAKFIVVK